MNKKIIFLCVVLLVVGLTLFLFFGQSARESENQEIIEENSQSEIINAVKNEVKIQTGNTQEFNTDTLTPMQNFTIQLRSDDRVMQATLYNNATSRDFVARLPLTLPMIDLYQREIVYNFPESLETDNVEERGYEVGEIIYWPPMHSFVIMYRQNGERFAMQQVGELDSGVEFFADSGDIELTFELVE